MSSQPLTPNDPYLLRFGAATNKWIVGLATAEMNPDVGGRVDPAAMVEVFESVNDRFFRFDIDRIEVDLAAIHFDLEPDVPVGIPALMVSSEFPDRKLVGMALGRGDQVELELMSTGRTCTLVTGRIAVFPAFLIPVIAGKGDVELDITFALGTSFR